MNTIQKLFILSRNPKEKPEYIKLLRETLTAEPNVFSEFLPTLFGSAKLPQEQTSAEGKPTIQEEILLFLIDSTDPELCEAEEKGNQPNKKEIYLTRLGKTKINFHATLASGEILLNKTLSLTPSIANSIGLSAEELANYLRNVNFTEEKGLLAVQLYLALLKYLPSAQFFQTKGNVIRMVQPETNLILTKFITQTAISNVFTNLHLNIIFELFAVIANYQPAQKNIYALAKTKLVSANDLLRMCKLIQLNFCSLLIELSQKRSGMPEYYTQQLARPITEDDAFAIMQWSIIRGDKVLAEKVLQDVPNTLLQQNGMLRVRAIQTGSLEMLSWILQQNEDTPFNDTFFGACHANKNISFTELVVEHCIRKKEQGLPQFQNYNYSFSWCVTTLIKAELQKENPDEKLLQRFIKINPDLTSKIIEAPLEKTLFQIIYQRYPNFRDACLNCRIVNSEDAHQRLIKCLENQIADDPELNRASTAFDWLVEQGASYAPVPAFFRQHSDFFRNCVQRYVDKVNDASPSTPQFNLALRQITFVLLYIDWNKVFKDVIWLAITQILPPENTAKSWCQSLEVKLDDVNFHKLLRLLISCDYVQTIKSMVAREGRPPRPSDMTLCVLNYAVEHSRPEIVKFILQIYQLGPSEPLIKSLELDDLSRVVVAEVIISTAHYLFSDLEVTNKILDKMLNHTHWVQLALSVIKSESFRQTHFKTEIIKAILYRALQIKLPSDSEEKETRFYNSNFNADELRELINLIQDKAEFTGALKTGPGVPDLLTHAMIHISRLQQLGSAYNASKDEVAIAFETLIATSKTKVFFKNTLQSLRANMAAFFSKDASDGSPEISDPVEDEAWLERFFVIAEQPSQAPKP